MGLIINQGYHFKGKLPPFSLKKRLFTNLWFHRDFSQHSRSLGTAGIPGRTVALAFCKTQKPMEKNRDFGELKNQVWGAHGVYIIYI